MCKRRLLFIGVFVLAISSVSLGFGGIGSWGSGYAVQDSGYSGYQVPAGQVLFAGGYQAVGLPGGYGGAFAMQGGGAGLERTTYRPNAHMPSITDVHTQGAYSTGFQFSTAVGYPSQPYANYQWATVTTRQGSRP